MIVEVATRAGAEAIHPGFGFLAENSGFARACAAAGVTFIGPPPEAMDAMASKTSARQVMAAAGVPIVPGVTDPVESAEEAAGSPARSATRWRSRRLPVAAARASRSCAPAEELEAGYESARREGAAYFADDTVYLERYLDDPRHIEVQVLAEQHGDGRASGRAGLLDPAPPPEDRGGDALAGRSRRSCARAIGRIGVDAARAVGYTERGHGRGLLAGRRHLLLPRDEHAPAGGAHHHRGGRRGSIWCASSCGSQRESRSGHARIRCGSPATRSSAASTPRIRPVGSFPPRG